MDEEIKTLIKRVITDDLGDLISKELALRFKPIESQIDSIQNSQDLISKQLTEDRYDINQVKIDIAKIAKQNGVIIDNQNTQEAIVVEAVKQETNKIPNKIEESLVSMFEDSSFIKKFKDRFFKKKGVRK